MGVLNEYPTKNDIITFINTYVEANKGSTKITGKLLNFILKAIVNLLPEVSNTIYVATLSQTGTDAPTAIVRENTTGATLTWTRDSAGFYRVTADSNIFADQKYTVTYSNGFTESDVGQNILDFAVVVFSFPFLGDGSFIQMSTFLANAGAPLADELIIGDIKIEIYN